MDPQRVLAAAGDAGLGPRLLDDVGPTPTVDAAAAALKTVPAAIGKSILLVATGGGPVLVLATGTDRVDLGKVARHLGVAADDVRMARPSEVRAVTGYDVGGVPPVGHPTPVRRLLDHRVLLRERMWFGGGTDRAMLEVATAPLADLPGTEVGDFVEGTSTPGDS